MPTGPRAPRSKADVVKVVRLETPHPEPNRRGRPRKLTLPPLPQELLDGFTPLEREHFTFFIEAHKEDYGISKPSDLIALTMAACEYINLIRVNATSAREGEVITAARQHPGVQLRAWLDSMSTTRKARKQDGESDPEKEEWTRKMRGLSAS